MSSRAARRGLGRGLASLIPDDTFDGPEGSAPSGFRMVPVEEIRPNPEQPRTSFDEEELAGLTRSIRESGILTPLVVRKHEGRYYLIAGERRLRAATRAGLSEVPVVLRQAEGRAEQLELALVENLQRSDLDPVEAAAGYARLVDEFGLTQAEVAERVGKNRSTISNAIRLLELPGFALEALREGRISAGHARALIPVPDPVDLRDLLARVEDRGLSVRATERLVREFLRGDLARRERERRERERSVAHANRLLTRALSTQVTVKPRKDGGGRIVIDYGDPEQLEALIEQLRD